jgi:hypothetical protein
MWQRLKDEVRKEHSHFDEEVRAWLDGYTRSGGRVFCDKGCRECCNLAVNCTFTEALCIAETLSEVHVARVREHAGLLRRHIHEAEDLKDYLRMHRQKIGFCPFLEEDGSCGVYEERPFSCRSLLATQESLWCGADFTRLSSEEKRAFIERLDPSVVSFPMHYVAASQERGQELEFRSARRMTEQLGFSFYGSLPFLVFLERELQLSGAMLEGYEATVLLLERAGLRLPFLITFDGC